MKTLRNVLTLMTIAAAISFPSVAFSHEGHKKGDLTTKETSTGELVPAASVNADWLAKAKAEYPVESCIVSGDKLEGGDMGPPQDFVYRVNGKPDQLVRFCCKDCVKDFRKDPEKYLRQLRRSGESGAQSHGTHH
ncbi:hypothetical protein [Opitutus terrae]|uniref:TRASH transcription regulator C-terminal archaeal domain-containing protein n=1 Tax=Opitutus terrae (strain DSM 11246 / JCM 15787 / PB90-1) TaxID=452637 RepID=B1ZPY7_OPITP|nr:hypothetical protein [Opitutus terrae]ACB77708.1 hypothetical protein Oter_4437 [Opitutus terrae PB90-1]